MEIEENVNAGIEKRQFSKIPFDYLKNMQSQIVVCDSRHRQSGPAPHQFGLCKDIFHALNSNVRAFIAPD